MTPLAFVPHSLGALWGLVRPVTTFEVTGTVAPDVVEEEDDALSADAFADHDGTGRLVRSSADEYGIGLFSDDRSRGIPVGNAPRGGAPVPPFGSPSRGGSTDLTASQETLYSGSRNVGV